MKRKFLYYFMLFLLNSLVGVNCKKEIIDQLPPETQEGKFTLGFKINDKVYSAIGMKGFLTNHHVSYNLISSDSSLFISARNTTSPNFSFQITIKYSGSLGLHSVNAFPYSATYSDYSNGSIPSGSNTYSTSASYNGKVNIKYFDGTFTPYNNGNILAGTFEIDVVNADSKVIHITEGRFDIGK